MGIFSIFKKKPDIRNVASIVTTNDGMSFLVNSKALVDVILDKYEKETGHKLSKSEKYALQIDLENDLKNSSKSEPLPEYTLPLEKEANTVYRFLCELAELEEECHNMNIIDKKIANLYNILDEIKTLSQRTDYVNICTKGVLEYKSDLKTKPKQKHIALLQNPDNTSLIESLSKKILKKYFEYWDAVISNYTRKSAKANRIQYLIVGIKNISNDGLYRSDTVKKLLLRKLGDYEASLSQ